MGNNSTESLRRRVISAIHVIAANSESNDQAIVDSLRSVGYDELDAEVLVAFLPLGLARAIISRLPDNVSTTLSDHAIILSENLQLELPLMLVAEFVEALSLGDEAFTSGEISKEVFSRVAPLSVELNLVNQMLHAGTTAAEISPPVLIRLGEVSGFKDWYRRLMADSGTI